MFAKSWVWHLLLKREREREKKCLHRMVWKIRLWKSPICSDMFDSSLASLSLFSCLVLLGDVFLFTAHVFYVLFVWVFHCLPSLPVSASLIQSCMTSDTELIFWGVTLQQQRTDIKCRTDSFLFLAVFRGGIPSFKEREGELGTRQSAWCCSLM